MTRRTTISLPKELRKRLGAFEDSIESDSAPDAVEELLNIAADEGYWDGESGATVVSVERVKEIEETQKRLAEEIARLRNDS